MFKQLLIVAILSATALYASAQPLAEHVPGDALVYVGWRGADDPGPPGNGYDGSNLQALREATDLPAAIGQAIALVERMNPADEQAAHVVHMIRTIGGVSWRRPTALYVQPVEDADMPMRLVMLWEAQGDQADAMMTTLGDMARQDQSGGMLHGREGGLVWLAVSAPGHAAAELGFEPEDSLARSSRFKDTVAHVDGQGLLVAYADAQGLLSLIDKLVEHEGRPQDTQMWMRARSALGLAGLNALAWTGGFDGADWRTDLFIDAPAPRAGVLTLLDGEPITDAELEAVPAEATWLCALRFDLGVLLDNVRRAIGEVDPDAAQQFEQALLRGGQMTGIDLEADLIRSLGSAWMLYTDPGATGSGMLGMCLVNPLKDAEKAEQALTALQALANAMMGQAGGEAGMRMRFQTSERDGMTLRTLGVPFVGPTWSVHEGRLYVGLFPQTVLTAGAHASAGGDSILDNDAYRALRDRLGGGRASVIVFADLPRTAEGSYQNLVMLSQMGAGMLAMFGVDPAPTLLPPYAAIQPLLSPAGEVAWSDDEGYHCRTISPFPGSMMLGPGGGTNMMTSAPLLAGIMLPALGSARQSARQQMSMSNMRQVLLSMHLYATDHNELSPEDIAAPLLMGYITEPSIFVSPDSGAQAPPMFGQLSEADRAQWVRQNSSYVLIPMPKLSELPQPWATVCLFERPEHASDPDKLALGFADGHVESKSVWEAKEQIEAQTGKTMEELIARQQNYRPAEAAPNGAPPAP